MTDVVLVSRSIGAATGGGIGSQLFGKIDLFAAAGRVTVICPAAGAPALEATFGANSKVRISPIAEPAVTENDGFYDTMHRWSAQVLARLRELYPAAPGPAYIEFSDYLAEAVVTLQAKRTADPVFGNTTIGVLIATTTEICDVLNGSLPLDLETETLYGQERYCLAFADYLVHSPGDIYATYQRFYGADQLAPGRETPHICPFEPCAFPPASADREDELRILYYGRLERRKGVHNLISALANCELQGWRLTIVGADTPTGPLKSSMRNVIEQGALNDPRIEIRDAVPQSQVSALIRDHDVVISPSLWECGPNTALEALACNRPLLVTPVGGQVAMAIEGRTGMQAAGTSADDLYDLVTRAVSSRGQLREMAAAELPVRHYEAIADRSAATAAYQALINESPPPTPPSDAEDPLVSIVIPYFRLSEYIERTVRSACGQSYSNVEVLIVNDGSFAPEDEVLDRIAERFPVRVFHTPNRGVSAARNFGIAQSAGEFVLTLDADNVLHEDFTARCMVALRHDPEIAYASSWFSCIDPHDGPAPGPSTSHPISNFGEAVTRNNIAGDAVALFRRRVFEGGLGYEELLFGFEDWSLFRNMREWGLIGHVVPEYLFQYRIRGESMLRAVALPNAQQLYAELAASDRSRKMQWTSNK